MAVTNTSHGFPAVRAENGSSFTSAPSHGFHVDTAAFSDGWPDGRFWTQIGSTFDPNPYGMVMQTQRASTKSQTLPNTLSKNPTGRSKDSPIGYKRGTAWSKDFPVRYKRSTAWSKDFPVGYKRSTAWSKDFPVRYKGSTARLKDFPLGDNRGTAWSKDSPVRYKKVLVGRRLSSRVEKRGPHGSVRSECA